MLLYFLGRNTSNRRVSLKDRGMGATQRYTVDMVEYVTGPFGSRSLTW